jgi:hypothetical protein
MDTPVSSQPQQSERKLVEALELAQDFITFELAHGYDDTETMRKVAHKHDLHGYTSDVLGDIRNLAIEAITEALEAAKAKP